jgi:hypothetical protein
MLTIEELLGAGWQDEIEVREAPEESTVTVLEDLAPFVDELDDLLFGLFDAEDRGRFEDLLVERHWKALPPEMRDFFTDEIARED